jgi:hypothetical protein
MVLKRYHMFYHLAVFRIILPRLFILVNILLYWMSVKTFIVSAVWERR